MVLVGVVTKSFTVEAKLRSEDGWGTDKMVGEDEHEIVLFG
jgi:hypothetical protein